MRSFERHRLGTIHPVERLATEIDPAIQVQLRATFARAIRWRWMGQVLQLPLIVLTFGGGYLLYDHLSALQLLGLAVIAASVFAWAITRSLECPSCENTIDALIVTFCPQCGDRLETADPRFDLGSCKRCGPLDFRDSDGIAYADVVVRRGRLILRDRPHRVRHCTHCGLMLTEVTAKKP